MERGELGARLHAQLLDEHPPGLGEHVERLGLPPAAVVGEHELGAQPLAQRMLAGERAQLGDEVGVPAEPQVEVDEVLHHGHAALGEPFPLVLRERPDRAGERLPGPQAERGPQRLGGLRHAPVPPPGLGLGDEALELGQVERALAEAQGVPAADRGEQPRPGARGTARLEHAAQPRHVGAQRAERAGRRPLAPDPVDDLLGGDHAVRADQQHREDRALQRGAEVELLAVTPGPHRPENGETQPMSPHLTSHSLFSPPLEPIFTES